LELPKERVFWAPFVAGPVEVRERRVGGILFVAFVVRWNPVVSAEILETF
jgi:hypothetical protein